jgi:hypothetical protein
MGLAVSLIIAAVGLILALAVHPSNPGSVDVNTVGWILFLLGLVGFILDLMLWSQWGPGYLRSRRTVVAGGPGYAARPAEPVAPVAPVAPTRTRTVVEEVDEPPAGPPPGY